VGAGQEGIFNEGLHDKSVGRWVYTGEEILLEARLKRKAGKPITYGKNKRRWRRKEHGVRITVRSFKRAGENVK